GGPRLRAAPPHRVDGSAYGTWALTSSSVSSPPTTSASRTSPIPETYAFSVRMLGWSRVHSAVSIAPVYEPAGTLTLLSVRSTTKWSSAWPARYSCEWESPICGWAGMKIPGTAPFTPASHEPSVLVTLPASSSSAVSSPTYQTLPSRSCVYQSSVRSTSLPFRVSSSWTTIAGAPFTIFVSPVT